MRNLILGILLLLAATLQAQRTIHIPADSPTIQSAIDASTSGDTLLVAPGIYLENLDFHGKAITLQSTEGPAVTILDGRRLAPTVSFTTGETRASTLSGFTIRNGAPAPAQPNQSAPHGAGILLIAASPTLSGNLLTDNLCAAIDATASAPLIAANRITLTHADPACLAQAIAPITLTGASASATLLPTLTGNTIEQNDLTGTNIQPNAGAIALLAARAILQSNTIRRNTVPGDAPAVQILAEPTPSDATPTLFEQNLVYANTSRCSAGLSVTLLNDPASTATPHLEVQILNNTIADNLTDPTCAGAQAAELALAPANLPAQVTLVNNILTASGQHPALLCAASLPAELFHHNLLANTAGLVFSPTCPDSAANLLADPQFLDRAQSDYHLTLHSTAVDAGSNAVSPMLHRDLDNAARPQNATRQPTAIIDLGAYEYPAAPTPLAPTTTVLNATPFPSAAFQTVTLTAQVTTGAASTTPSGSITFTAGPRTLATVPLNPTGRAAFTTTTLTAATYTLLATYTGSTTLAASISAPILQTVSPAATLLAFSVTPSNAATAQTVTLTAHVTAPLSTRTPTGAIQFFDLPDTGSPIPLGAPTLDPTGQAILSLTTMTPGAHRISAAYPGTPDFAPVLLPTGNALPLTIGARDYAETLATPTLTLVTQHHGPVTVTFTSLGSFADTVSVSCANLPPDVTCAFTPATTALTAGSSTPITLMIDTDAVPGFVSLARPTPGNALALATLLPLGLLALARRRRLVLLLALLAPIGCGAGKYPDHTPPGAYQIAIVSQANATGIAHTTQLTLIVTP